MELFNVDFSLMFFIEIVAVVFLGAVIGVFLGALPGLGVMVVLVLLFPVSYSMSPLAAVLLLLSAYQSAEYGGSISSITLGIPGTPSAAPMLLDGYTMAKKESAAKAIGYSLTSSCVGGLFGAAVLIFLSGPLSAFALKLSDPEFFLIGILGLLAVAALSSSDAIKSFIAGVLGLMAGTVGVDIFTGARRFTGGMPELLEGINIVVLIVGVFAFTEIFSMVSEHLYTKYKKQDKTDKPIKMTFKDFLRVWKPTSVGSVIGSIVGIFPGMGAVTASWFSYSAAKKMSKSPETFGKGNPEGIVAPESANNAAVGGSLLPMLTLGIPASPAIAVVMGAFIIHGIQPGPSFMANNPKLIAGLFIGFILTTVAMYIVGVLMTPMFSRVLKVKGYILVPIILMLSILGIYASKHAFFDIWLAFIIGLAAFALRKLGYSLPVFILAFVLGPIIEESLRRTLVISGGSYSIFFSRTYSVILLLIIAGIFAMMAFKWWRTGRTKQPSPAAEEGSN